MPDFDRDDFDDVDRGIPDCGVAARLRALVAEVRRVRQLCRDRGWDPDTGEALPGVPVSPFTPSDYEGD